MNSIHLPLNNSMTSRQITQLMDWIQTFLFKFNKG